MREEEEFRPVLKELVELLFWAYVIIATAFAIPADLGLIPAVVLSLADLVLTVVTISFAVAVLRVYWLHSTERYAIGKDYVRVERGTPETSWTIPFRAVTQTECRCIPFNRFRVGSVVITTETGFRVVLRNIKNPYAIAERIKPVVGEPVFRPSVG
ncbi:MAG: hypothetical protein JRN11_07335 [Nitrososphaerota archaeon]|nr:hypothetical protein [Nitrososphaerota archaeon]MDG7026543.1 hypothetical protein [Nitrososphaerota archaeon]